MASGSVPVNYQYTKIDNVNILKSVNNQGDYIFEKGARYFWDGGN